MPTRPGGHQHLRLPGAGLMVSSQDAALQRGLAGTPRQLGWDSGVYLSWSVPEPAPPSLTPGLSLQKLPYVPAPRQPPSTSWHLRSSFHAPRPGAAAPLLALRRPEDQDAQGLHPPRGPRAPGPHRRRPHSRPGRGGVARQGAPGALTFTRQLGSQAAVLLGLPLCRNRLLKRNKCQPGSASRTPVRGHRIQTKTKPPRTGRTGNLEPVENALDTVSSGGGPAVNHSPGKPLLQLYWGDSLLIIRMHGLRN